MTPPEKEHITRALQFELSKCSERTVRVRMLGHLEQINGALAAQVAEAIGEKVKTAPKAKPGGTADVAAEMKALGEATSPLRPAAFRRRLV